MSAIKTELYRVENLFEAFEVAHEVGARGIGLDLECVLMPYIGNDATIGKFNSALDGAHDPREMLTQDMKSFPNIKYGIMTNNSNSSPKIGRLGVVEKASYFFGNIPFVHKGVNGGLYTSEVLESKPSGKQGRALARILGVDPEDMVLIDDQGFKAAGEAVNSGFRAAIVPLPIGPKNIFGHVKEHRGVMAGRLIEPAAWRSFDKYKECEGAGLLAKLALQKIGQVDIDNVYRPEKQTRFSGL